MAHPPSYRQQYPGPPARTTDRVLSTILLVLSGLVVAGGAGVGLLLLAFLDHCPPERCSFIGGLISQGVGLGLATAVAAGGLVVTLNRLKQRRIAAPVAALTLVSCALFVVIGGYAYVAAVGW